MLFRRFYICVLLVGVAALWRTRPALAEAPPLPGMALELPVDLDLDGVSTYGDQYAFNFWLAAGGNLADALENATASGNVLDMGAFFRSPAAALSGQAAILSPFPSDAEAAEAQSEALFPDDIADTEIHAPYRYYNSGSLSREPLLVSVFAQLLPLHLPPAEAAFAFFAQSPELALRLGLAPEDFRASTVYQPSNEAWLLLAGHQLHDGLPVEQATWKLFFEAETGRVRSMEFSDLSRVQFGAPGMPGLSKDEAVLAAQSLSPGAEVYAEPGLLYARAQPGGVFHLTWVVLVRDPAAPETRSRLLLDAHSGALLRSEPLGAHFEVIGTVNGRSTPLSSTLPDYSGNPPQWQSVPGLKVYISWAGGNAYPYTSSNGVFSYSGGGDPDPPGTVTVNATLNEGTFIASVVELPLVSQQKTCNSQATCENLTLALNFGFSPNKRSTAHLNAWQWATKSRNFLDAVYARTATTIGATLRADCVIPPCQNLPCPAQPVRQRWPLSLWPYRLDMAGGAGFEDGPWPPQLWFGAENASCGVHAMAYSTIVCHEFGHYFALEITGRRLIEPAPPFFQHDLPHAEGLGDIFSSYAVGSSKMAEGLKQNQESTSYLRDLETGCVRTSGDCEATWNYDRFYHWSSTQSDSYQKVMPYSGAWWDLRKKLKDAYGTTGQQIAEDLFIKYYDSQWNQFLKAPDLTVAESLLGIDDSQYFCTQYGAPHCGDGNPQNGTPHKALIVDAFVRRNLYRLSFKRGDANASGTVDISDSIFISNWLNSSCFTPPPCPQTVPACPSEPTCRDSADVNDDGKVDNADTQFLLGWLFGSCSNPPCPAPPSPGPFACGVDPTWQDKLTCIQYSPCTQP